MGTAGEGMARASDPWAHAIEAELRARPEHGWPGRMPDFFVVGHVKSGTTALHTLLAQHPQVFVGAKEARFFSTELRLRDLPRKGQQPLTVAQYTAWYGGAAPEQIVGDVSPVYLWSEQAPALIAQARPDATIIAILREPASFVRSLHLQWLQNYVEVETDLRRALALEGPRREGHEVPSDTYWPRALMYMDFVRYVEQLRRFHAHFPRERVHVVLYDDFRRDNAAAVRSLLGALGVDPGVALRTREANPSVQVRAPRLNALLRRVIVAEQPSYRMLSGSVKALTPMRLRQRLLQTLRKRVVYGPPESADDAFTLELRRRLKPEVTALSEYLGRDLAALWGYDSI